MAKNRFEMLKEWYDAGKPSGAKYSVVQGCRRFEYSIEINLEHFSSRDLFEDKDIEYIPPEPEYKEITPDEAVICLLNKEALDFRNNEKSSWINYKLRSNGELDFETYRLIKEAKWRKKVQ